MTTTARKSALKLTGATAWESLKHSCADCGRETEIKVAD